ncbi:hypothetical protein F5Y05DRAFT_331519 [Hypoxylon sp. FL0543]|nr:hypothetical protein F5Y05DRAFT_331519 [Hypoxylon sp. FL0543]
MSRSLVGTPSVVRCNECKVPIFTKRGQQIYVFVGCLVDTEWLDQQKPDAEIRVEDKCAWLPKLQRTPTPSPEPDVELVAAVLEVELARGFHMNASENSYSEENILL